jgi:hypothetical protein
MKTRPICLSLAILSIVTLLALLPGTALAQDPNLDGSALSKPTPAVPSAAPGVMGPEQPMGSGTIRSTTWVAATRFTGKSSSTAPDLSYAALHFYTSPGSTSPEAYFAPLELEQGLLVDTMTCAFKDGSATHDLSFDLQKSTINFNTPIASWTSLGSGSSSGSGGISFVNIPIGPETIQNQVGNVYYQYIIRADVASDVSFAGCMIYWTRQVSPAPASATFSDVPTSHPFFRFIQALYSSGITAGCSPTTFCPDNALTRGEMAVFLAKGLGLNYPN